MKHPLQTDLLRLQDQPHSPVRAHLLLYAQILGKKIRRARRKARPRQKTGEERARRAKRELEAEADE